MKKQLLLIFTALFTLNSFSQVTEISGNYSDSWATFSYNNKAMIFSTDGNNNFEIWQANAQNEAELFIALPDTSDGYYAPFLFTEFNNKIYYKGYQDSTVNLMEIDGNTITTITNYPKNLATQPNGLSNCNNIVVYNNKLYFTAINNNVNQLISYDGNQLDTVISSDIVSSLKVIDNKLYFVYYYIADNTSKIAHLENNVLTIISGNYSPYVTGSYSLVAYNNNVYFDAYSSNNGYELWKTDGNTASFVHDFHPGMSSNGGGMAPYSSFARPVIVFKEKLYIEVQSADDGAGGYEGATFTYDDNTDSIQKDEVLNLGIVDEYRLGRSIVFNDKLYYVLADSIYGREIYVYDGTNPPSLLMDINPGASNSYSGYFIKVNNKLYFNADNGNNNRLFVVDEGIIESISVQNNISVSVFPNPTNGEISFSTNEDIKTIEIYDIRGQKISSFNNSNTIDIEHLTKGIYFAKIYTQNNKSAVKQIQLK